MQITPIASADPVTGQVRIADDFVERHPSLFCEENWPLPTTEELRHDDLEFDFQNSLQRLANVGDHHPVEIEPTIVSSRQAVIAEASVNRRFSYSIGTAVRNERSRSHKLKKSRLRNERRGR